MLQSTKKITLLAFLIVSLSAGKFVLSQIPNVEIVTLLILVYSSTLKTRDMLLCATIFCVIEAFIYGVNSWLIAYIIYWNTLVLLTKPVTKLPCQKIVIPLFAIIMTAFFGILTSLIDTGLFTGFYKDFFRRFAILYIRGGYFYLAHIISNLIAVGLLYPTLNKLFYKLYLKYIS